MEAASSRRTCAGNPEAGLSAHGRHRRRVDGGEPEGDGPGEVAQLGRAAPRRTGRRRGGRRGWHVGEDPAAAPGYELGDGRGLGGYLSGRIGAMFMAVPDSTRSTPAEILVGKDRGPGPYPAGGRARIVDRQHRRLARRVIRERPGVPRREGAGAVRETRTCGVAAIESVTDRHPASAAARERASGAGWKPPGVSHGGNVDLPVRPPVSVATVAVPSLQGGGCDLFGIRGLAGKQVRI